MKRRIRLVYLLFTVLSIITAVLLVISIYYQRSDSKSAAGDFCTYLKKIATLNSKLDLKLTVLLLVAVIANTIAYFLFLRIVDKYFNKALS